MKKIYSLLILSLLISCTGEKQASEIAPTTDINFSISLKEVNFTRAAITNGLISNLNVLVFDGGGRFISRHMATAQSTSGVYKVSLPLTSSSRVLHFVANYDWSNFSDAAAVGRSETDLIPSLSVGSGVVAYWQRLPLGSGITSTSLTPTISLLRNVLQVSTVNLTTGANSLTNLSFAIGDQLDKGTLSPFNPGATNPFATVDAAVAESPLGIYKSCTEADLKTAGTSMLATGSTINMYERKNATSSRPAYVIIKGFYQTTVNPTNTTVASYYKIDLANAGSPTLLNLARNNRYILKINSITNAGYPTLAEAMMAPGSNNVSSSILVQSFTSVSDGTAQLNIETANMLLVKSGTSYTTTYSYIPNAATGIINNANVTATLTQDGTKRVVSGSLVNNTTTGTITFTTDALPALTDVYTATITITANGVLQRTINLRLRQPYAFTNLLVNPVPIANAIDQPVELHFTIPSTINSSEFPLLVYISTKKLSPNLQYLALGNLELDVPTGEYRYTYKAQQAGEQIAYFVSNSTNSTETVTLSSPYFTNATYALTTGTRQPLSGLSFSPNGDALTAQKGQTVTMSFTIPIVAGATSPFAINIYTSNLDFVSAAGGTVIATSFGYQYTTTNTGAQTIVFKTNKADNEEYVRIDEQRYAAIGFMRLCKKMDLVAPRFSDVNGLVGTAVNLQFTVPSTYNFALNDNKCDVSIYTTQLEPVTVGLVPIVHPQYGVGYRYTATAATLQTVQFKTLTSYTYETAKLTAMGFNTASILRTFTFGSPSISPLPKNTNSTSTNMTMTFTVPPGSVPSDGVAIRIDSQDMLVAFPATQAGLARVGASTDATGYFVYTVNASGTYTLTFRNRSTTAATRQQSLILSSPAFASTANLNL